MLNDIKNKKLYDISLIKCLVLLIVSFDMICACNGAWSYPKYVDYILWTIELSIYAYIIIPDFIKKPYISKEKVVFLILCILSGVSALLSHNRSLLYVFLTCWIIKEDDLENVFKVLFLEIITLLALEIISYLITKYLFSFEYAEYFRGGKIRYSLGVGHPNHLALFVLNLSLLWFYVNQKRLKAKHYIICLLLNVATYLLSDCRTVFLLSFIMLLLFALSNVKKIEYQKMLKIICYTMFPILGIGFFVFAYLFSKNVYIAETINKLLSGRLFLTDYAIKNYGITLFGQYTRKIATPDGRKFIIETIYPYFLCYFGSIWLPIFSYILPKSTKNGEIKDYVLIIIFCLYGVTEHIGINFVLLCSTLIFKNVFHKSVNSINWHTKQ